jgi:hypothetical protein
VQTARAGIEAEVGAAAAAAAEKSNELVGTPLHTYSHTLKHPTTGTERAKEQQQRQGKFTVGPHEFQFQSHSVLFQWQKVLHVCVNEVKWFICICTI